MSLKFGKTIRTLSLSQNYLVLIKKSVASNRRDKLSASGFLKKWGKGTQQIWLTTIVIYFN